MTQLPLNFVTIDLVKTHESVKFSLLTDFLLHKSISFRRDLGTITT